MSIRAPHIDHDAHPIPEEHVVLGYWEPTRWHRVICEEAVLAESSDPDDSGMAAALTKPGAILQRASHFTPSVVQWHQVDTPPAPTLPEDPDE